MKKKKRNEIIFRVVLIPKINNCEDVKLRLLRLANKIKFNRTFQMQRRQFVTIWYKLCILHRLPKRCIVHDNPPI